ncbi:hypothetical protein Leryth_002387 [Lithospermum erythrorhizon]|nr:hypothetical protein Leryth_002387 [Lithospermum erythrorhizon]
MLSTFASFISLKMALSDARQSADTIAFMELAFEQAAKTCKRWVAYSVLTLKKNGLSPTEVAVRFSNCSLYVTCEPCIMCASALSFLGMMR